MRRIGDLTLCSDGCLGVGGPFHQVSTCTSPTRRARRSHTRYVLIKAARARSLGRFMVRVMVLGADSTRLVRNAGTSPPRCARSAAGSCRQQQSGAMQRARRSTALRRPAARSRQLWRTLLPQPRPSLQPLLPQRTHLHQLQHSSLPSRSPTRTRPLPAPHKLSQPLRRTLPLVTDRCRRTRAAASLARKR